MAFNIEDYKGLSRVEKYSKILEKQLEYYKNEKDIQSNINNTFALLHALMEDINWCGIYYFKEGMLVLGPFQGFPACTRINIGKGVCGTSAIKKKTIVVPDVHLFPGHISCDERSQSEIVIPLLREGKLLGVLDIDAPVKDRFQEAEIEFLNTFLDNMLKNLEIEKLILD